MVVFLLTAVIAVVKGRLTMNYRPIHTYLIHNLLHYWLQPCLFCSYSKSTQFVFNYSFRGKKHSGDDLQV